MSNVKPDNYTLECDEDIATDYNTVTTVLSLCLCMIGFVYTFFGYRCFKTVMFLSGLIFGASTAFLMCWEERIFQQDISLEIAAGIASGIGVLCGLITMLVLYIGLFLQGFFLGTLAAIGAMIALQSFYHPQSAWVPVGIIFGTGIIFSLLTLKFQKNCVILSTAALGSLLVTICIDYFLERFLLLRYAWEALLAAPGISVCWYTWVILSAWPTLSFAGMLVQVKITGNGYDHKREVSSTACGKQIPTPIIVIRRPAGSNTRPSRGTESNIHQSRSRNRTRPQGRSVARQQTPASTAVPRGSVMGDNQDRSYHTDTLPPSYYECVELGVGEPVTSSHQIIRTDLGTFVSRPADIPPQVTNNIQGNLLRNVSRGAGYVVESEMEVHPSAAYIENANARNRQQQNQGNRDSAQSETNQPDSNQFSNIRSNNVRGAQRSGNRDNRNRSANVARRLKIAPSLQQPRSSRHSDVELSDTQSLLSQPPKPSGNREAVAAHAKQIRLAENRKAGRRALNSSQIPNIPEGNSSSSVPTRENM